MIDLKLQGRTQQALYDRLRSGQDVAFAELVAAMGQDPALADEYDDKSRNKAQSILGRYFVRLNRRLAQHNLRVKPGLLKRTYRLAPLK